MDKTEKKEVKLTPKVTKPVTQLARERGLVRSPQRAIERGRPLDIYSVEHSAASALHGWHYEESVTGVPLQLTEDDYVAALNAAVTPNKLGKYTPHGPAVSPQLAARRSK